MEYRLGAQKRAHLKEAELFVDEDGQDGARNDEVEHVEGVDLGIVGAAVGLLEQHQVHDQAGGGDENQLPSKKTNPIIVQIHMRRCKPSWRCCKTR